MARIIKRYENRKLYDTENRKYISLEEIANLIRQGEEVQVIDNTTEADITVQTLTQVIVEEGKRGRNPLSSEVLHEIIRWGNHLLDDSLQQVRHGLDQLVPNSLGKLFGKGESSEISELKKRIESLEQVINTLANQLSIEQEKNEENSSTN
ncbi:MAG: hypothetical protein D6748_06195 [Calditrichaeota bacterium]|nr:MAG: hypothetical protein D6748_06195 [Calditrichota bacterium]